MFNTVYLALPEVEIRLADAGIGDFNSDFSRMRRCTMDILKAEGLVGFISNSSCSNHSPSHSQKCIQSLVMLSKIKSTFLPQDIREYYESHISCFNPTTPGDRVLVPVSEHEQHHFLSLFE